jgi:hypothetical protein
MLKRDRGAIPMAARSGRTRASKVLSGEKLFRAITFV